MKIKLNNIVAQFLDSKDGSSHEFRRLRNMAVRGMRAFNMDITGRMITIDLEIGANRTAMFPEHCVTWSKIGVANLHGTIYPLRQNKLLTGYIGNSNALTSLGYRYSHIFSNYGHGGSSYNLFGVSTGGFSAGGFNIDEDNRIIRFDTDFSYSTILFEFLPDGYEDESGDYEIDIKAEEAFMAWLRWNNAKDLPKKFSQSQIRGFSADYHREKRLAKMRLNPAIISEMENTRRSLIKLVARA